MRQLYYLVFFIISCGQAHGMLSGMTWNHETISTISNTNNPLGGGLLFYVCVDKKGKLEEAEFLVEHGADINQLSKNNGTPLAMAAVSHRDNFVEYLLSQGADPNIKSIDSELKWTPLDGVCRHVYARVGIVIDEPQKVPWVRRLLLIHNSDIYDTGDSRRAIIAKTNSSPLVTAIILNDQEKISEFLEQLTYDKVNEKHENGLTLLHWAVGRANAPLVKELLDRDAHVLVKDDWCHTPLMLAERIGNRKVRKLLLEHMAYREHIAQTLPEVYAYYIEGDGKCFADAVMAYINK